MWFQIKYILYYFILWCKFRATLIHTLFILNSYQEHYKLMNCIQLLLTSTTYFTFSKNLNNLSTDYIQKAIRLLSVFCMNFYFFYGFWTLFVMGTFEVTSLHWLVHFRACAEHGWLRTQAHLSLEFSTDRGNCLLSQENGLLNC